jgi:hypothetical protein
MISLAALACIALAYRRFEPALGTRLALALAGAAYGVFHLLFQGKGWPYHAEPLVLYACAAAGAALRVLRLRARAEPGRGAAPWILAGAQLAAVLLAARVLLVLRPRMEAQAGIDPATADWLATVDELSTDLRARVPPGAKAQLLDYGKGGLHAFYRLGIVQPTRFVADFPLLNATDRPYVRGLQDEFLRGLEREPPAAIVVFRDSWPGGLNYARFEVQFPAFATWLGERYELAAERERYRLYTPR